MDFNGRTGEEEEKEEEEDKEEKGTPLLCQCLFVDGQLGNSLTLCSRSHPVGAFAQMGPLTSAEWCQAWHNCPSHSAGRPGQAGRGQAVRNQLGSETF